MIGPLRRFLNFRSFPGRAVEASERALSRLEDSVRHLGRSERRLLKLEKGVSKQLGKIASLVERAKAIAEANAEDVKEANRAIEQSERAMEMLRTQHDADSTAIETLASRIKEYQALSEANIAIANHRRGQMIPGTEREM